MSEADMTEERAAPVSARISLRLVFIGGTLLLLAAGLALRLTAPKPIPIEVASDVGIPVGTLTIAPTAFERRVRVSGIVQASRNVELFAEQMGRVREIGAEALDWVTADQLLMQIDPLPGKAEVAQAEAALAQAKSKLDLARSELGRFRELVTSRVSSASDLDRKRNSERVALAEYRAAEASLSVARDRLSQRTLVAPFDGVLRTFDAEVGEYVSPGQPIGELLDVSRVRLTVGLRDLDVVAVSPGMQALVRVDALPGETHSATVLRVARAADPTSRKFPVQLEIGNAQGRLMPGMVASVDLDLGSRNQALLVPHDAVLDEFGLRFVYVIDASPVEEPVVRRRRVEARSVPFQPGTLEVTRGLHAGERIATTSLRQLRDGSRVEPQSLTATTAAPAPPSKTATP
ncbi:MAG: efflux RND transporter periplasmic adaptor subunit [Myxococcota bacterium]